MGFPLHTYSPEKCLWPHLSQFPLALSFAPVGRPYVAKDEMSQWDRAIVPQYCICVQIFLSRIQAFPLWREVCSPIPQNHQPLGLGFQFAVPCLYFSKFFSWDVYRSLCACFSPRWTHLFHLCHLSQWFGEHCCLLF